MLDWFFPVFAWCSGFALGAFVAAALLQSFVWVILGICAVVFAAAFGLVGIAVDSIREKF